MSAILALDQGTTSSRAIVFDERMRVRGSDQREFAQHFPQPGWVEHDPRDIWATQLETRARRAAQRRRLRAADVAAIGITNQRETTLVWDRASGKPIANAIVWQDRRTVGRCATSCARRGVGELVAAQTGLRARPVLLGDEDRVAARQRRRRARSAPRRASSRSAPSTRGSSGT